MKNDKKIDVNMYAVENDNAVFVEVSVFDKEAQEHTGLFLVDSGCTGNKLSTSIMKKGFAFQQTTMQETQTIGNQIVEEVVFSYPFTMGGCRFDEEFTLLDGDLLPKVGDMPILGILGNIFLQKHSLAVDLSSHRVYTSDVSHHNLSISDCSYFFSMIPGLKSYGVPVVPIKSNDGESIAIVDTGCTNLIIAEGALDKIPDNIMYNGMITEIHSIAGTMNCKEGDLPLCILGFPEQGEDWKEYPVSETVAVAPVKTILSVGNGMESDEEHSIPEVDVLLGSPFIASAGWILDFGAKIIYRRK